MVDTAPFLSAIEHAGYRLTDPRRDVASLIADQTGHFVAADLVASAHERGLGIGRATIFRTLDLFATLGLVARLDLPTGDHAYVACEPAHHHHVVCVRCGRTEEVDDAGLRRVVLDIGRRTGYRIDDHRLEVFGTCPACSAALS